MILFAMDRHQYVLVDKALSAYISTLENALKVWGTPENSAQLKREQNTLRDIKALQDLLLDLKARERI